MTFSLAPGKLGFKIGDVLVGLQSGTTDTPETGEFIRRVQTSPNAPVGAAAGTDNAKGYRMIHFGGQQYGAGLEMSVTNSIGVTMTLEDFVQALGAEAGVELQAAAERVVAGMKQETSRAM